MLVNNSRNTLIVCGTVMFLAVVAGLSVVFHYATDASTALNFAAVMVGLLATTIASFAALLKVDKVDGKTDQILNGAMEAKIIGVLHQELPVILTAWQEGADKRGSP